MLIRHCSDNEMGQSVTADNSIDNLKVSVIAQYGQIKLKGGCSNPHIICRNWSTRLSQASVH